MSKPLTLIQLVSDQTMQNLLPVLRLKPSRLIHFTTPRTQERSKWIAEGARQAHCPVILESIELSAMPGMAETMHAVQRVIKLCREAGGQCLLNFTGGTKLMSIGAYVAALKEKTPSLYVDTQDALFVDGQTDEGLDALLKGDWTFTPILPLLSVNAVAVANGCSRITGGRDLHGFLGLAEHLFKNEGDEEDVHEALQGRDGIFPRGNEPRRPVDWLDLIDQPIRLPASCRDMAANAGLVRIDLSDGLARLPDESRAELEDLARSDGSYIPNFAERYFAAVNSLQHAASFLSGGWWEAIVAEQMKRSGRFRDIRWSVRIGEKRGPDLEEDIVALEGVQAVYVSCKRGGMKSRLLPLLDEIDARARTLGGTFTRRFLAILRKPNGKVLANLEKRARELRIKLIFPETFDRPDPFG